MSKINEHGNIYNLLPLLNSEGAPLAMSNELLRYRYSSHSFYILNPNARTIIISASPNGVDYFPIHTTTAVAEHVHPLVMAQYIKASSSVADGGVKVIIMSGDVAAE